MGVPYAVSFCVECNGLQPHCLHAAYFKVAPRPAPSGVVDGCNTAYQSFVATPGAGAYTTLKTNCNTAATVITPVGSLPKAPCSAPWTQFPAPAERSAPHQGTPSSLLLLVADQNVH